MTGCITPHVVTSERHRGVSHGARRADAELIGALIPSRFQAVIRGVARELVNELPPLLKANQAA